MTPLPGGSGAQEGGFYLFFQQAFPAGTLVGALLLWRFMTYYLSIIIGFTGVLLDSATMFKRHRGAAVDTSPLDEAEKLG